MKYKTSKILSVIFTLLLSMSCSVINALTKQDTLDQYISALRNNPNDYTLREKIINLVLKMKVSPAIPEEAKKHMNRGMAAGEGAKNENDYKDAIEEFQSAVNIAPWLGEGYRNLAVMQDKVGQYSDALNNLKLYLLTNPSTADADAAKSSMDKIEYRQEKAAKEALQAEQKKAEEQLRKQREEEQREKTIDFSGYWREEEPGYNRPEGWYDLFYWRFVVTGNDLEIIYHQPSPFLDCIFARAKLVGREFFGDVYTAMQRGFSFGDARRVVGKINQDNSVVEITFPNGDTPKRLIRKK